MYQPCEMVRVMVLKTNSQRRCGVTIFILFFSWKKKTQKRQQQFDIWSCSVLWTVVHSLSLSFLHLFSPFHFFLAHLICEWGGSIAAHLLSTALRLLISNYGCVFIVTAQSFSWKVAHFQQRVLSPSSHEVNSSVFSLSHILSPCS